MSTENKNQTTDNENGEAAAGTKQLSQPVNVATSATIEDGGASNKGYKEPPLKQQK
jgi:hypothetical protein